MARTPKSHTPPTGSWSIPGKRSDRAVARDPRTGRFLDAKADRVPPPGVLKVSNRGRVTEAATHRRDPLPPARKDISWSEAADRILDRHHGLFVKLADK